MKMLLKKLQSKNNINNKHLFKDFFFEYIQYMNIYCKLNSNIKFKIDKKIKKI